MTILGALLFGGLLAALFLAARAFVNDVLLREPDEYDPFDDDNC